MAPPFYIKISSTYLFELPVPGTQQGSAVPLVDPADKPRHVIFTLALLNAEKNVILPPAATAVPSCIVGFTEDGAGGSSGVGISGGGVSPQHHIVVPGGILPLSIPPGARLFGNVRGNNGLVGGALTYAALSMTTTTVVEPSTDGPEGQTEKIVQGFGRMLKEFLTDLNATLLRKKG